MVFWARYLTMMLPRAGLVLALLLLPAVWTQINQINSIAGSGQTAFYLDAARDCDGTPREVGQSVSMIYGKSTQDQGTPTQSCTLTLNTENIWVSHRFKLKFLGMYIGDPGVHFYVYDGELNGRLRWAFSKTNGLPPNLDFDFTTGQQVTFRMTRGRTDTDYDIRVVATPVPTVVSTRAPVDRVQNLLYPSPGSKLVPDTRFTCIVILAMIWWICDL